MKRSRSHASSSNSSYLTADESVVDIGARARPSTLSKGVSPPPVVRRRADQNGQQRKDRPTPQPTTAQVEAGLEDVVDHVEFFSQKLASCTLPASQSPRLSHTNWLDLYSRNQSSSGHHFVIHQHDHPIAGTHYDLRLQINDSSSISFAIMYGLPGDPNSRRLNRNATETRVHCLWNHLIETASAQTGTMLIWDTGEYEVLQKVSPPKDRHSDTEPESDDGVSVQSSFSSFSEPDKLAASFSFRKIRLRLHGTRLPSGYTIYLRLTKENDRSKQPKAPAFKRRRQVGGTKANVGHNRRDSTTSDSSVSTSKDISRSQSPDLPSESSADNTQATRNSTHRRLRRNVNSLKRTASPPRPSRVGSSVTTLSQNTLQTPHNQPAPQSQIAARNQNPIDHAPGDEVAASLTAAATAPPAPPVDEKTFNTTPQADEQEQEQQLRAQNAYPGALNSVNSIHQRKWYLSLDRTLCGFTPIRTPPSHVRNHHAKTYWVPVVNPRRADGDDDDNAIPPHTDQKSKLLKQSQNARGFARFHVLGREHERSVVTGRLAADILKDEGVQGYVPRGLWRAVVE